MNKLIVVTAFLAIMFVLLAGAAPAFASSIQIQSVIFHYQSYAGDYGAYIESGSIVTIVVSLRGSGTFYVCPEQKVEYLFGGTGDNIGFMCETVKLGNMFGDTSGTVSLQRVVRTSAPGWLLIRVHVLDANGSHSIDAATSLWYKIVIIH
jgi:hypothetical protein